MGEEKRDGDTNIQVIRSVPFWPAMCAFITIIFAGGGMYAKVAEIAATQSDTKSIMLSISGKLTNVQMDMAEQKVRVENIGQRTNKNEGEIQEVRKDVWKLQQGKK